MVFNCLGCGISVSTKQKQCPYCKINNTESIEMLTGTASKPEKIEWREKVKGTILSYVQR